MPQELVTVYEIESDPGATANTLPVPSTVARDVLSEDHDPPVFVSVRLNGLPGHTVVPPDIIPELGSGFTVIKVKATAVPQELLTVYLMVSTPAETAVTVPPALMVAIAVDVLLHVPPPAPSVKFNVCVGHSGAAPLIAPAFGVGLTTIPYAT